MGDISGGSGVPDSVGLLTPLLLLFPLVSSSDSELDSDLNREKKSSKKFATLYTAGLHFKAETEKKFWGDTCVNVRGALSLSGIPRGGGRDSDKGEMPPPPPPPK